MEEQEEQEVQEPIGEPQEPGDLIKPAICSKRAACMVTKGT